MLGYLGKSHRDKIFEIDFWVECKYEPQYCFHDF